MDLSSHSTDRFLKFGTVCDGAGSTAPGRTNAITAATPSTGSTTRSVVIATFCRLESTTA